MTILIISLVILVVFSPVLVLTTLYLTSFNFRLWLWSNDQVTKDIHLQHGREQAVYEQYMYDVDRLKRQIQEERDKWEVKRCNEAKATSDPIVYSRHSDYLISNDQA